jgi:Transposase
MRSALDQTILGARGSFNPGALRLIFGRTIMLGFGPPASRSARREWWRRRIQRQKEGSRSVAEFCRRLGVSTVTFYAWKRRFREAPAVSRDKKCPKSRAQAGVTITCARTLRSSAILPPDFAIGASRRP